MSLSQRTHDYSYNTDGASDDETKDVILFHEKRTTQESFFSAASRTYILHTKQRIVDEFIDIRWKDIRRKIDPMQTN